MPVDSHSHLDIKSRTFSPTASPTRSHNKLNHLKGTGSSHQRLEFESVSLRSNLISSWSPGQEFSDLGPYDPNQDALDAQEKASKKKKLKFRQLFRYSDGFDRILMSIGILLAVIGSLITPAIYYWAGLALQDMVIFERCNPQKDANGECTLKGYCEYTLQEIGEQVAIRIVTHWLGFILLQTIQNVCFIVAADRQTKKIRGVYFETSLRKDMAWFDMFTDRDFAKSMNDEIANIRLGMGDAIPNFVNATCTMLIMLVLVFYLDYKVALWFFSCLPVCIALVVGGDYAERQRTAVTNRRYTHADKVAREDLANIKMIKMYEGEQVESERYKHALDTAGENWKEIMWMCFGALSSGSVWLIMNVAVGAVCWFGYDEAEDHDTFCTGRDTNHRNSFFIKWSFKDTFYLPNGSGKMLLVYFGLMYVTMHTMYVANLISLVNSAIQTATGVFFIIDWQSRIDNLSNEGRIPKHSAVGRVDFHGVTFRYPKKPDEITVDIPSLTIFTGQFIVFAGAAGSGKSTILRLIPRLYDVCSGYITLDAINLQNYSVRWLRSQIFLLSENPIIFTGTIMENILFGKLSASQEDIEKVCRLVLIHDHIQKLPNGYNTIISNKDSGDHLSRNGKRQLCLARAYLHRSRVVLLDNPIKKDDDELEPLLLQYVNSIRDTATVIMASTHVNSLSKRADCIYYMEKGRITEYGSHIQLIQARGKYCNTLEALNDYTGYTLETKHRLDSQLQAYKLNQILVSKRKSANVPDPPIVEPVTHTVPNPHVSRNSRGLWGSFMKVIGGSISGSPRASNIDIETVELSEKAGVVDLTVDSENADVRPMGSAMSGVSDFSLNDVRYSVASGEPDQAHIGKPDPPHGAHFPAQKEHAPVAKNHNNLEDIYRRESDITKRRTSNDKNMHYGFGLMGFQRMNFSRPMTNYATQIQKQRHGFLSGPAKITSPQTATYNLGITSLTNPLRPPKRRKSSLTRRQSAIDKTNRVSFRFSDEKRQMGSFAGSTSSSSNPVKKRASSIIKNKDKTARVEAPRNSDYSGTEEGNGLKDRKSFMDAIRTMTNENQTISWDVKECAEVDDIEFQPDELEDLLRDYDESISSTVQAKVVGRWLDLVFVSKHDWVCIVPGIIASIFLGLSIPIQTALIGVYFQSLSNDDLETTKNSIYELVKYIVFIGAFTFGAAFLQEFCFGMAGKRMTRSLRKRLFSHMLTQDLTWFDENSHDIGILTFQLYADTTIIHHMLLITYGIITQAVSTVIMSMVLAVMQTTDHTAFLTGVSICLMPIIIYVVYFVSTWELREAWHLNEKFNALSEFTQEYLHNLTTWASLGAEPFFIKNHNTMLNQQYSRITLSGVVTTCFHSIIQTSYWLLYALFIYVMLGHQYPHHHDDHNEPEHGSYKLVLFLMTTTELLIFGGYRIGDQVVILGDTDFGKSAAHKLKSILISQSTVDPPIKDKTTALFDDADEDPPEISLANVYYKYPGSGDDTPQSLMGITLRIPSGSYVAIVGPPNSGKSTLCNIILRMCDPTFGLVEFNGEDLSVLSPKVTRKIMGFVEYDPCLFGFSIGENIQYGNCSGTVTKQQVEDASKLAMCHYDILDLPDDYKTEVSLMERTTHNFALKQRISYARALLRKPRVLVIDDATTSLGTESDHQLLQIIADAREGRSMIVFSHKIEPIRDADLIYVLWDGEVVEVGSDAKLLSNQAHYYEMYMTQKVLAETMRNSPKQLSTIQYSIKNIRPPEVVAKPEVGVRASMSGGKIGINQPPHAPRRKSSLAYFKFLDEKMNRIKAEKQKRLNELDQEVTELEKEEKEREHSVAKWKS